MKLTQRLRLIHDRLVAGDRTASLDLFKVALEPVQLFLISEYRTLALLDAYDLATEVVAVYAADPKRCDPAKGSVYSWLCRNAKRDAIDLFRRRTVANDFDESGVENDVEFWASRTKDVFGGEDAIDARRIITLHGGRLAGNETEAKVLTLILHEEKRTEEFAQALGLSPDAADTEKLVKQAKDRMLLRLKRLRHEL